ncbi:MAG: HYR domain-containing protein [Thaumarchaeota archaeon]|nr:HYR domain-containing protein [Nitrososphaerota archaeon]
MALLLPLSALAQTTNELSDEPGVDNPHILGPDDSIGPVGRADDLYAAHSDLTDIMKQQSLGDFDTPDYPFVMSYVDEERGDLVIMMDAMAAAVGFVYEPEDVAFAIGHAGVPVHIEYGMIVLDASQNDINQWKSFYDSNCKPVKPGYQSLCTYYKQRLVAEGVNPDSTTPAPKLSRENPCDADAGSLACYYYKQYQSKCIPNHTTARCNTYKTQINTLGYEAPTTKPTTSKVSPPPVSGLKAAPSGDGILVTWDVPQYGVNYYRVYVYEDGKRIDRDTHRTNSYTYDSPDPGKEYEFRVYVYYKSDSRLSGTSGGYSTSNAVAFTSPPVILQPVDIDLDTTDSTGRTITYEVSAYDDRDALVTPTCSPKSGTKFAVGTTTVTCSAVDSANNKATVSFKVVVNHVAQDTEPPVITVPAPIVFGIENPRGLHMDYAVSAHDNVDPTITVTCSPGPKSFFRIGTTTVTCSATDDAGNKAKKSFIVRIGNNNHCVIGGIESPKSLCDAIDDIDEKFRDVMGMPAVMSDGTIISGNPILTHHKIGAVNWHLKTGTIGLIFTTDNGTSTKMLTASHIVNPTKTIKTDVNILHALNPFPGQTIGPIDSDSVFRVAKRGGNVADAAVINVTTDALPVHPYKIKYEDQTLNVTSLGGVHDLEAGARIYIAGIHNDGLGGLQYKDITVKSTDEYNNSIMLVNQTSGSYPGQKGDSGAPIFVKNGTDATFLGIHVASGCVLTLSSGATIDLTYDFNGVPTCKPGLDAAFKIFTPWENIVDALDLDLQ